ncbi:MAG: hypothetical protein AAFZ17_21645, partial [Cyanobacteria bacterium J06650_10]
TEDALELEREQVNKLIKAGDMVPLIVEQPGKVEVTLDQIEWQAGSQLTYMLHDPTPQLIKRLSGARKPSRQIIKPQKGANAQSIAQSSAQSNIPSDMPLNTQANSTKPTPKNGHKASENPSPGNLDSSASTESRLDT